MIITFASAIGAGVYQFGQFYTILQDGLALTPYHVPVVPIDDNEVNVRTRNDRDAGGHICVCPREIRRRCGGIGHCAVYCCGGGGGSAAGTSCAIAATFAFGTAIRIMMTIRTETKWQNHCSVLGALPNRIWPTLLLVVCGGFLCSLKLKSCEELLSVRWMQPQEVLVIEGSVNRWSLKWQKNGRGVERILDKLHI